MLTQLNPNSPPEVGLTFPMEKLKLRDGGSSPKAIQQFRGRVETEKAQLMV